MGEKPSEGFASAGPPPKFLISKALLVAAPFDAYSSGSVAFGKKSKFILKKLTRGSFRIQAHENKQSAAVPVENFNANAGLATHATQFTATAYTFSTTVTTTSDKIVVFRCVPASAP